MPFTNQFTIAVNPTMECNVEKNFHVEATGSHGLLDLRIKRPFFGIIHLPSYTIASLYSCMSTDYTCSAHGAPTINYTLSGTVIVPQKCIINAGDIVRLDFGTMLSGHFIAKGQKPDSVNPVTKEIKVICNGGVESMANLTIRFQCTPDAHYPDAIASDNADVGVVVTDTSHQVIKPNTGLLPFTLNNSQATVTFIAYPVSTTGHIPSEGSLLH